METSLLMECLLLPPDQSLLLFACAAGTTLWLAELQAAAGDAERRADGQLQRFGEFLMKQVDFNTLQAQVMMDRCYRGATASALSLLLCC